MKSILPRAGQVLLPALLLWTAAACAAQAEEGIGKVARAAGPGHAAIASAHPAATEAGFEILAQGGNAFDAAVAVSAALSVAEPHSSGIGGGGFFLLHQAADQSSVFVDARETAPSAATRDMYLDENGEPVRRASLSGPLAAGIRDCRPRLSTSRTGSAACRCRRAWRRPSGWRARACRSPKAPKGCCGRFRAWVRPRRRFSRYSCRTESRRPSAP